MFDVLGLSKKCTDISELSKIINEEIKRSKQISLEERKNKIITLLASMLEHGFWITYPKAFCYHEIGDSMQNKVMGKELADGFFKFLNNIEKNKSIKI